MNKIKLIASLTLKLGTWLLRIIKGKPFCGAWATFQYLDDACSTVKKLQNQGYHRIVTHSPCPREELEDLMEVKDSFVPFFSFIFGLGGLAIATTMVAWMSLQWVLPVSGKPIVSVYPMVVITFELIILFGVFGTLAGMLLLGKKSSFKTKLPKSKTYKLYSRFSQDRFGIVVQCDEKSLSKVSEIMRSNLAEEVHSET